MDWVFLVIARQAAVAIEPTEGAFDDPAARQRSEAFFIAFACRVFDAWIGAFDDFKFPFGNGGKGCRKERTLVTAISPNMAQGWELFLGSSSHRNAAITILRIRGLHLTNDQEPLRIDHDVAITPFGLLANIETARPSGFGGFNALTIDNSGFWTRLFATALTHMPVQDVMDFLPQALMQPSSIVGVDCFPTRKLFGQKTPRATRSQTIKDRIDNFA